MGTRLSLQTQLETLLGSSNVYYQPPASIKLVYPCIVYDLDNTYVKHANNKLYKKDKRYSLTYITRNPDDPKVDAFLELDYCAFNRSFTVDNLHHYTYTLYY